MTQSFIDSTIQIALYGFHQAQMVPGADIHMKRAIEDAKDVVVRLKRMARGNINEKYILWKCSELESQVWLEERDLVLKKMKREQAGINELIKRFNAELAERRPDFTLLWKIHAEMEPLDPAKAHEILRSARHRSLNVSRDLLLSIERAVLNDDIATAQTELAYCTRHRRYLALSDAKYEQLGAKISSRISAGDKKARLKTGGEKVRVLLSRNRLAQAGEELRVMRGMLSQIQPYISGREWLSLNSSLSTLEARLCEKEDSLVDANLRILKTRGVDAGVAFYEDVVMSHGVRGDKLKILDDAVMAVAPSRRSRADEAVSREMDELSRAAVDNGLTMEAVRREARRRADSIAAEAALKAKILALEQARRDSIRAAERAEKERLLREKRDTAHEYMVEVYDLLEENRIRKAYRRFQRHREYVQKYMQNDTYVMLETTVLQAYSDMRDRRDGRTAVETVALVAEEPASTPPKQQKAVVDRAARQQRATETIMMIYEQLERGQAEQAYASFMRAETELEAGAPPEVVEMLRETVAQARQAQQEEQHREQAKQNMAAIYDLLEQKRITEAYRAFERYRELIRKYAGEEPYTMLEQIIYDAYQFVQ